NIDKLSPNVVLVNQEVKEVEAIVIDGEMTGPIGLKNMEG
nr:hypothetical protein [Tanacetum cinerariifolium]